jgi:2-keto-4-pentenoate hydratase/2-oxohepta-3-ene-1,7-dioic acid hydratase in catechol pathway
VRPLEQECISRVMTLEEGDLLLTGLSAAQRTRASTGSVLGTQACVQARPKVSAQSLLAKS